MQTTRDQTLIFSGIPRYTRALTITAALIVTAFCPLPALVDLAHPDSALTMTLERSLGYELVAPASNVLDALTLLSPAQYLATFGLCALVFLGWVFITPRARRSWMRLVVRFVGGTVAIIGTMLVAKRPMASLRLEDANDVAVDFHSHTSASHDGRAGFDAEENRSWHSSAGFNVAYVTDHRTFDGALRGIARNPALAGNGTVLLPGVELRESDEHPILIGVDPSRMRITSPDWKEAAVEADGGPAPPILFLSLPGNIRRIPGNMTTGAVRIAGIEISDGCPRGIAQSQLDRDSILSLANRLGVATVSATDNHGWGRTAPAWSVMRIPGWREMKPTELDVAIRRTILDEGSGSVRVVARRTAVTQGGVATALGGLMVGVMMFRTMDLSERLSWAAWWWSVELLIAGIGRRQRRLWRIRVVQRVVRRRRQTVRAAA
jgi:hypothetical protein